MVIVRVVKVIVFVVPVFEKAAFVRKTTMLGRDCAGECGDG